MKHICLIFLLGFVGLESAFAFWDDDKKNVCYNWNGDREPCGRSSLRRESLLGGQFNSYYGDRDASFTGSYSQGLVLSTVKSHSSVRFLFGGQFLFSNANAYIAQTSYKTQMLSADLMFGVSIKPFKDTTLQPVFELAALGGFKSLQITSPPPGIDSKNLAPSYGGKLSLGLDLRLSRFYALRPAVDYQICRLSGIVDGERLNLDSLGFSLSLVFL